MEECHVTWRQAPADQGENRGQTTVFSVEIQWCTAAGAAVRIRRSENPWSVSGFLPEQRIMPYCVESPREHSGGPMPLAAWIVAVVAVSFALAYLNSPGWVWIAAGAVALPAGLAGGALAMDAFSVLAGRSEEHTSELQSPCNLVCRLLLEK